MIEFVIPGPAVGKGRPRIGKVGAFARLYTPEKTVSYESLVAAQAYAAMFGQPLLEGAVDVRMLIVCQVPASWSQRKQAEALAGRVFPTSKPDIDNVEKAIFDAMNGVVWKDDVQVVDVIKSKRYGAAPRVEVTVIAASAWAPAQQAALPIGA